MAFLFFYLFPLRFSFTSTPILAVTFGRHFLPLRLGGEKYRFVWELRLEITFGNYVLTLRIIF
jgi:hypothetical protein